jgi:hypothetical protein
MGVIPYEKVALHGIDRLHVCNVHVRTRGKILLLHLFAEALK